MCACARLAQAFAREVVRSLGDLHARSPHLVHQLDVYLPPDAPQLRAVALARLPPVSPPSSPLVLCGAHGITATACSQADRLCSCVLPLSCDRRGRRRPPPGTGPAWHRRRPAAAARSTPPCRCGGRVDSALSHIRPAATRLELRQRAAEVPSAAVWGCAVRIPQVHAAGPMPTQPAAQQPQPGSAPPPVRLTADVLSALAGDPGGGSATALLGWGTGVPQAHRKRSCIAATTRGT